MKLNVNYLFYIDFFDKNFQKEITSSLDYGCGNGNLVLYANKNGYNFRGIDNYYDSNTVDEFQKSLAKECIDLLNDDGTMPYSQKTFDFICSEQVFEHIKEFDLLIEELDRVLKNNGKMLHVFPFKYYVYEGHFGIPFFHWFSPSNKLRKPFTLLFHNLGFGYHRNNLSFEEWYNHASKFIDNYCFYRTKNEIIKCCKRHFTVVRKEKDKVLFHLSKKNGIVARILKRIIFLLPNSLISFFMQIRGTVVLELRKTVQTNKP